MNKLITKVSQTFFKNNILPKLTVRQEAFKNTILKYLKNNQSYIWDTNNTLFSERATGKTFLINDVAFELQSMGYTIYVISEHNLDYYANYFSRPDNIQRCLRSIILFDDVIIPRELLNYPSLKYGFVKHVKIVDF